MIRHSEELLKQYKNTGLSDNEIIKELCNRLDIVMDLVNTLSTKSQVINSEQNSDYTYINGKMIPKD